MISGVMDLLFWPWRRATLVWPGEAIPEWWWTWEMLPLLPLAIGVSFGVIGLGVLLWQALRAHRTLRWLLLGIVLVPSLWGAWQREAVLFRLLPSAGTNHTKDLHHRDSLRYADLAPNARRVITPSEFEGWQTWSDVAASLQKVPRQTGPAYLYTRYHMEPVEGWGEAWVVVDLNPLTGKVRHLDLIRDPRVAMVGFETIRVSGSQLELEVANRWAHPIDVLGFSLIPLDQAGNALSPTSVEVSVRAHLAPRDKTWIRMTLSDEDLKKPLSEFAVRLWWSSPETVVETFFPFTPPR